jgi:hypothetical protein
MSRRIWSAGRDSTGQRELARTLSLLSQQPHVARDHVRGDADEATRAASGGDELGETVELVGALEQLAGEQPERRVDG